MISFNRLSVNWSVLTIVAMLENRENLQFYHPHLPWKQRNKDLIRAQDGKGENLWDRWTGYKTYQINPAPSRSWVLKSHSNSIVLFPNWREDQIRTRGFLIWIYPLHWWLVKRIYNYCFKTWKPKYFNRSGA